MSKAAEKEEKERLKAEAKKAKKEQKKREALDKAKKHMTIISILIYIFDLYSY